MNRRLYKWLRNYKDLINQIDYLEFNLEVTERELERWEGGNLSKVFLTKESKGSKVENNIESIKNELTIKKDQKERLVQLIENFDGLNNKILKLKYVDGMTLEIIAEELSYSPGYIQKKHAEIMKMIKFAEKVNIY